MSNSTRGLVLLKQFADSTSSNKKLSKFLMDISKKSRNPHKNTKKSLQSISKIHHEYCSMATNLDSDKAEMLENPLQLRPIDIISVQELPGNEINTVTSLFVESVMTNSEEDLSMIEEHLDLSTSTAENNSFGQQPLHGHKNTKSLQTISQIESQSCVVVTNFDAERASIKTEMVKTPIQPYQLRPVNIISVHDPPENFINTDISYVGENVTSSTENLDMIEEHLDLNIATGEKQSFGQQPLHGHKKTKSLQTISHIESQSSSMANNFDPERASIKTEMVKNPIHPYQLRPVDIISVHELPENGINTDTSYISENFTSSTEDLDMIDLERASIKTEMLENSIHPYQLRPVDIISVQELPSLFVESIITNSEDDLIMVEEHLDLSIATVENNLICRKPLIELSQNKTNGDNFQSFIIETFNESDNHIINGRKASRKRIKNESTWVRNIIKKKRNMGKAYENHCHKFVAAKNVKASCAADKCQFNCSRSFNILERQEIFARYWNLGDLNKQREFIVNSIQKIEPKYRYALSDGHRSLNSKYYFNKSGNRIRVCKFFFKNTLAISNSIIDTAKAKFQDNVIVRDNRGCHNNHPKLDDKLHQDIRSHISSFPTIESHYLRQQTTRKFLDGSLNLSLMYRLYVDDCKTKNIVMAKKHLYEKIFNEEFNLGFFVPKKDQCVQCEQYKNYSTEEKKLKEDKHHDHIKQKELSRLEKNRDKIFALDPQNKTKAVCFDLQAVIPLPSGDVSSFYYKRRLATYNFTLFDLASKKGFCFVWHEGLAHRGSNEIGSVLLKYLVDLQNTDHVIFFSDNCSGQNKNKYILSLYVQAIKTLNIESITHKFLVVGHTQNEGDNMHSLIEKNKSRCLKSGPLYTPDQLMPVIQLSKVSKPHFQVSNLETKNVYDLKELCTRTGKNFTKNSNGQQVVWNEVKMFRVEKCNPLIVKYKTSYDDTEFKEFRVGSSTDIYELSPAFPNGPPAISAAKKKDLMDLCKENSIPAAHHSFFSALKSENESTTKVIRKRRSGV